MLTGEWGTRTVAPGALVEFNHDKKILCGLCLKADKKNIHLLSEENREVGINPQRVVAAINGFMSPTALREDVVTRLRKESARREELKNEIQLADLWELIAEEQSQYTVEDLARIFFGNEATAEQASAMIRALRDDRIYFERKNELYVANSAERVQQLLDAIRAEANKAQEREEMTRWLQSIWLRSPTGNSASVTGVPAPASLQRYLDWFKDVAIFANESSRFKDVQSLLARAGIQQRDAAFQVLVKAGLWQVDENVLLHKFRVPIEFPREVEAAAEAVVEGARGRDFKADAYRRDLTGLPVITIDDEHTVETDDGVSLEKIDGGWRVGVHIADPAEFVEPGSTLDREALHRGTSIYFPEMKIPMLPPVLGTGLSSLQLDEERPALSVLADLDDEGNVLKVEVVESVVSVREKLTYDEVDDMLERRDDLATLLRLAHARRAARRAAGAIFVPFPSVEVHVHSDEEGQRIIDVRREEHDSVPSHILVSEWMILANESVAKYCVEHSLPAIYRGQQPPSEKINIGEEFTALDGFRVRRLLRKGGVSLTPARHSGLGLDAYLQFTSPIRRYGDLTMHRQIKHHLRTGETLFSAADIERITTETSGSVEQAEMLERARKSYWIFKHLEESLWQTRQATVLQIFSDRCHVQLLDTLVETDTPCPAEKLTLGDVVEVKIEIVWPRDGVLRVSVLPSSQAAAGKPRGR
jgi:exoribonuclease-2